MTNDRGEGRLRRWLRMLLEPAPDPRHTFAVSYERQNEMLVKVQQALLEIRASRERLEGQARGLSGKLGTLQVNAQEAMESGEEEVARQALEGHAITEEQLQLLQSQLREVELEERRLQLIEVRLTTQIERFHTRQEVIQARHSAAEAQIHVRRALTEFSGELGDLSIDLEQAERRTEHMLERAVAIDRILEAGQLDDRSVPSGFAELVDRRLKTLRDEIARRSVGSED